MPWSFILHGTLGGLAYILVQIIKQEGDEKPNRELYVKYCARLLLGALMGFFIWSFGLPDNVIAASTGYVGIDAVEAIFKRIRLENNAVRDKYKK